jgi:hypothetical protein
LRLACGVADDALVKLHDGLPDPQRKATRTNILRQLTRLARTADDTDILFFFFSGHGFQTADGTHYLLPVDCVRDAIEETALRFDLIVRHLAAVAAPHVVLLLDASRNVIDSGKAVGTAQANVDVNALCPPGVVTFCSSVPVLFPMRLTAVSRDPASERDQDAIVTALVVGLPEGPDGCREHKCSSRSSSRWFAHDSWPERFNTVSSADVGSPPTPTITCENAR